MQPRTCMLSAFTLSTAMFFGTAVAADLPKEGTWTATYSAFGMAKATPVGKERLLLTYDDNGLTVGEGLLTHQSIIKTTFLLYWTASGAIIAA